LSGQGRHDEAVALAEATFVDHRAALGDRHPLLAGVQRDVAMMRARAAEQATPADRRTHLTAARAHLLAARELVREDSGSSRVLAAEVTAELLEVRLGIDATDELAHADIVEVVDVLGASRDARIPTATRLRSLRLARDAYDRLHAWESASEIAQRVVDLGHGGGEPTRRQYVLRLASYDVHLRRVDVAARRLRALEAADPPERANDPDYASNLRALWTAIDAKPQPRRHEP
jgi:hypothetical protein